jgi:MEDS: MEthanogen/methylotroph, DcmR Sensory domain
MTTSAAGFRHEALLYTGRADFVARAAPIVRRALAAGEPVLVAIDPAKIELLADALGDDARAVSWKDIRGIGGNPARIIPVWRQFVERHGGRGPLLGFGEPIWAGRTPAELVESQRHEALLNLAFAGVPGFTLLCPYDTAALDLAVLEEAHRSHPFIADTGGEQLSDTYHGVDSIDASFDAPLTQPAGQPAELVLGDASTSMLHSFLAADAARAGLDANRTDDLILAVAAVASSLGRPDGQSRLRVWQEAGVTLAELSHLVGVGDPLAGREWPPPAEPQGGRGLWLANQLCDLVELRSLTTGATVRLHVRASRGA